MKSLLTLATILLLPLSLHARVLTTATTLKVNSPDGLTDLQKLKAQLTVACTYKSGIFWPETKSCGSTHQELVIKDGIIQIPQIETFNKPTLRNQLAKNYQISVSVSEGSTYLTGFTAYNEEAFKALSENKRDLNILKFSSAKFNVAVEGQDFFATDLAKDENAYVLLSISPDIAEQKTDDVLVSSSLRHYLWSAENKHIYSGKQALKDMKDISVPATVLSYLGDVKDLKLKVNLSYAINSTLHTDKFKAKVLVDAKPNALAEIGTLEFQPVTK